MMFQTVRRSIIVQVGMSSTERVITSSCGVVVEMTSCCIGVNQGVTWGVTTSSLDWDVAGVDGGDIGVVSMDSWRLSTWLYSSAKSQMGAKDMRMKMRYFIGFSLGYNGYADAYGHSTDSHYRRGCHILVHSRYYYFWTWSLSPDSNTPSL